MFASLGIERIELYVEPDNKASRSVAAAAGFQEEGLLRERETLGGTRRDMLVYSRLPGDPLPGAAAGGPSGTVGDE